MRQTNLTRKKWFVAYLFSSLSAFPLIPSKAISEVYDTHRLVTGTVVQLPVFIST